MKTYLHCIIFSIYSLTCVAQKPAIDSNAVKSWTFINGSLLSKNGCFVLYTIQNKPLGKHTLVVRNTKNNWKLEVPEASGRFTSDSKFVIFKRGKDSLGILKTGSNSIHFIPNVQSFSFSRNGNSKWLVYQLNNLQKTLVIYDLENRKERVYNYVKEYLLSEDGNTLLFLTEQIKDMIAEGLQLLNLDSLHLKTIWQGARVGNFVINNSNNQIAFTIERQSNNQIENAIFYYKTGMDKAMELATNHSIKNESELEIEDVTYFSEDDSCLFITLKQKDFQKPSPFPVDVWSYTDIILQSKQLKDVYSKSYQAVVNLHNGHVVRLENNNEMILPSPFKSNTNEWMLIINRPGDPAEEEWNVRASPSVFLISMRDGRRRRIPGVSDMQAMISPKGRYVIYFDSKQKTYYSYEIESGITHNLTKDIPVLWMGYIKDLPTSNNSSRGIAGWFDNDEAVLVYDEYDIWQIDIAGKNTPVNVTNGFGKKHHIVFALDLLNYKRRVLLKNERLIINAFNLDNKHNGYFSKTLSKSGDPELLSMGPYLFNIPDNPYLPSGSNFTPDKALYADVYMLRRMRADEAPNFFITSDFKKFTPLSDVHPETEYNWLTAELVTWPAHDGHSLQGILYKPENFDPKKKYPVIFNYYERKSDGLNAFLYPDYSRNEINIPWYTSNGYLVFVPDIHYKIGEPGESVINSVISAAQYLSKMPWVNPKKMGIYGFSFGGYETNFLVTHSNVFAAACSASGLSDLVSAFGGLYYTGSSMQSKFEFWQYRIGATLWQRPDLYIKNSPIFNAHQVTTPLLMMHTKDDGTCPFANAIELFTALRRLDKKVWMLQYEGNHFPAGNSYKDYNTRLNQFFDHYLKDKPAPKWMINGIPAKLKGIESGLEVTQKN